MTELVIVSAAAFEVEPLRDLLRGRAKVSYLECGVGPLAAARCARELGQSVAGKDVIFIGTAGSFGTFKAPYLVQASHTLWLPAGQRAGLSYAIKGIYPDFTLPASPDWAGDLPAKRVICSSTISLQNTLPEHWEPEQFVENLELYSCAGDLAQKSRSFVVVLGITNGVGSAAHEQWQANYQAVAKMTADFMAQHLPV